MDKKILVVSDKKRNIPFREAILIYGVDIIDANKTDIQLSYYEVAVIDLMDKAEAKTVADLLRGMRKNIPIIFVHDIDQDMQGIDLFNIAGYGYTKRFVWKNSNTQKLYEAIQSMMFSNTAALQNEAAIILPVYNEEKRFDKVFKFLQKLKKIINEIGLNFSVYLVNDGSADRTKELIEKISEEENDILGVVSNTSIFSTKSLTMNTRKAGTYMEAIATIDADFFIFIDADNSFEIEDVIKMMNILADGYYEIVAGTKDMTATDRYLIRRMLSFAKRIMIKNYMPSGVYDSQTGFKGLRKNAVQSIYPFLRKEAGLAIDLEILYTAKLLNFRVLQLPVKCIDQAGSHVNIINDSIHFLKILFTLKKSHKKNH